MILQTFTLAGSGKPAYWEGSGISAEFNSPSATAVDATGNIYIADSNNHRIRVMTSAGLTRTLGGNGMPGDADGNIYSSQFNTPSGIAVDAAGNIYVADKGNHRIRKINPQGMVSTYAGTGEAGLTEGPSGQARFHSPTGLSTDTAGNLYIADTGNHRIRKISPAGLVSTLAGNGNPGFGDGPGPIASFSSPVAAAADASGNIYVADLDNHRIRQIDANGIVSTLSGNGNPGFMDGNGLAAAFNTPSGLAVDRTGNVYVADRGNQRIRKIAFNGDVSTLAGNGTPGFADGAPGQVLLYSPNGLSVDADGMLYVADQDNHRIRAIGPAAMASTLAGSDNLGYTEGPGPIAQFNSPADLVSDARGNIYVADYSNHCIRKVTPDGIVSTLAGNGRAGFADGAGAAAGFNGPDGVAVDAAGNIYVADQNNHRIRRIAPDGMVNTFAGSGTPGFADGTGTAAQFNKPSRVTVDAAGNIYVADQANYRIRKITTAGEVSTLAGCGLAGYAEGTGNVAKFGWLIGIAADGSGNVYVADSDNFRIRRITPDGMVSTFAGCGSWGEQDGPGNLARFAVPAGLAIDPAGNIYVSDSQGHCVRKITPAGSVSTVAGGIQGFSDGVARIAKFSLPGGVAVGPDGTIYVCDNYNYRIRKIQ